jgi:Na+/H+ antiporter NhaD/arsenite permease-like protein
MTLIIVAILLFSYVLIATENITNVNKAAVAMFAGTVGWVLYICFGTDFVMSQHQNEYVNFLNGAVPTSMAVKEYIAQNIFLKYVGRAAEIVLFLLATMTIVEILNNNGCFDFLSVWMRTRKSRNFLWMLSSITFVISANLDNLTTTVMMLIIMHNMIPSRRQRMIYGSAIVIAANCGGALTVIGEPAGLVLWTKGAVTATNYSLSLILPCIVAWVIPTYWLGRSLPESVDMEWTAMPYRGDDTNLNVWQRLLMLFVGIGGLWFIPTFHNITKLSPFLGALCVLSVLWIVNEIFNRKLMNSDQMIQRRVPRVLQYGVLQMMLFVMGIMLAIGVVRETGALSWFSHLCDAYIHNVWLMGVASGLISTVLDNFATAMSFFSLHSVEDGAVGGYYQAFAQNGEYWKIIAYCSAMGGNLLLVGSMSGLSLMKMERMHIGWFFHNVGLKSIVGWMLGMLLMYFTI